MIRAGLAVLAAVIAGVLAASPTPPAAQTIPFESYPLEPPDTSSPRDTLHSFLRHANDAIQQWRAEDSSELLNHAARRALLCLDLSQLPPAVQWELGIEKGLLLKEILDRIELPENAAIPGPEQVASEGIESWTLPHTEITITRQKEGPRQGQFLFSAETVANLEAFYALAEHLPYKPGASIGIYEDVVRAPGDWFRRGWGDVLPAWSQAVFLEEALWQWIALLLVLMVFVATTAVLYLLASHWDRRQRGGSSKVGKILFVVGLVTLGQLVVGFIDHGINISGGVLVVVQLCLEVMVYVAVGWLIALFLAQIGESVISSQGFRSGAINSQLVRVCFRLLTIVVLIYLAIVAANTFGVPVEPLIASLGVGGLALALAVRPTLENILGGFTLFADKPVRVGDFCLYGDRRGTVEEIGLRSTRIRSLERTVVTVPNAEFSQMQIENFTRRDRMLFHTTLGLRYETTPEQLRYTLAKLRELLIAHPMVSPDPARVRFIGFGAYSLDVEIFAYVLSADYNTHLAIVEDLNLRIMDVVEEAGSGFAFPSQTTYLSRDKALDAERVQAAEGQVDDWRSSDALPFPDPDPRRRQELAGTLDYPPRGSVGLRPAEPPSAPETRRPRRRRWRAAE